MNLFITSYEEGHELLEELASRGITKLMDLCIFCEGWQRIFGDKAGMLVEEALRVEAHQSRRLLSDQLVGSHRVHHQHLGVNGGKL